MKSSILALVFISGVVHAAPTKFTEADYKNYTRDNAVTISVNTTAAKSLNSLGASCAKAALASVISKSFLLAEENGVDYPEIIEVTNVKVIQPTPWVNGFNIQSGTTAFTVYVYPNSIPCLADQSSVQ